MNVALARTAPPLAVLPALPRATAAALAAMQADARPVGQIPTVELIPEIADLLSGAALLLAHKNALDNLPDLELMAQAVAELLHFRFAGLKLPELSQAVRRGAAGLYKSSPDEVLYLSLPNLNNWLCAYQANDRHQAVVALQRAAEARTLPPPRRDLPAEVAALVAQAQAGGLAPAPELDFGNVLYDCLKTAGAMRHGGPGWPDGPPDYESIRVEETDALLAQPVPASPDERRRRAGFLDALLAGHWPADHPLARTVANACRKRVLREWLLQHAVNETDVLALLAGLEIETT